MGSRVVVVTGAGRGIGRAIGMRFAQAGDHVVFVARTEAEIKVAASQASEFSSALAVTADVSVNGDVERVCAATLQRFGRIDVLVNNAGISPVRRGKKVPVIEMDVAEWEHVLAINLTGAFLFAKHVGAVMVKERSGAIVNVASAAARHGGIVAGAHYVASKAGLVGLTKVLAREFGPYGIRVNAVAPGRIATPMLADVQIDTDWAQREVPLGRIGEPEEVADVIAFLASDGARYVTGATVDINGGWILY